MGIAIIVGAVICCVAVAVFERGAGSGKQRHGVRDRYAVDAGLRRVYVPGVQ